MIAWWESLTGLQQVLVGAGGIAAIITVIQTILVIIGFANAEADPDFDVGDDVPLDSLVNIGSLKLFTFRGIVTGLAIGGWLGYAVSMAGLEDWLTIVLSIIGMAVAMVVYAIAWRAALKLQDDGTVDLKNAVGKIARVYIPIPAERSGFGKVTLNVQDRFFEAEAVTDDDEKLSTDLEVEVVGIIGQNTLIVKRMACAETTSA